METMITESIDAQITGGQLLEKINNYHSQITLVDSTIEQHARNVLASDNEDVVYHLHSSAGQRHTSPHTDDQSTVPSSEKSTVACEEGDD